MRKLAFFMASAALAVAAVLPVAAQRGALTAADYARAEKFMNYNVTPLVYRSGVRGNWLPDDRVWYRVTTETGSVATLVDPTTGTKTACDLPACVAAAAGRGGRGGQGGGRGAARTDVPSPDGKRTAFIKDWNLWVRDIATGKETQLTTDGIKDFGYATDNAGWTKSDRAILIWSPDSKQIATFQQDQRKVGEMYLVSTEVGHPRLEAWKYPLPGDKDVAMIHRLVIDVGHREGVALQEGSGPAPLDALRSHRLRRRMVRRLLEPPTPRKWRSFPPPAITGWRTCARPTPATGEVSDVMEEEVTSFFESGNGAVNWRYLPASNEIIWFSQQTNWGHLYLHDLQTRKLKNAITTGEGNVTRVLRVDEKTRTIHFLGVGREKGRDPYFVHLYRVGFDGKNLQLLTPEDAMHDISLSPSGKYFTDSYSKPDMPAVAVLRDAMTGKLIAELEKADITKLLATGWKPPTPITVKGRDGQTDLYGLMYTPTNLEPSKKYPIINHIYPGPQTGSVGGRAFNPARSDNHALAELGFVVVEIDGMGTPWRSKKFHEAYYGNMGDNTLPDQVAGMKQLAAKYPVHRSRACRDLGSLRRRLRHRGSDVPLS